MVGLKPTDLPPTAMVKFIGAGTAACIADLFTFPLDTAKVRLQIQGESLPESNVKIVQYKGVYGTITTMVKTEGAASLYNGLVAGLQRQMSFASVRIGLYDSVKQFYCRQSDNSGVMCRLLAGSTTGALAVTFAQPTDVVKVRFQAHIKIEDGNKRYNGTVDAYKTIAKEEGLKGLWKGTFPNITRNAIVNCAELVTYDLIKEAILKQSLMTDNLPCHFVAAIGAGFCATVVASPVDVVKTRYMNSTPGQYKNALNCAFTMMVKEGSTAFYKGFVPAFLRLGSWNIVMFVSYEQLKRAMMMGLDLRASADNVFPNTLGHLNKTPAEFICLVLSLQHIPTLLNFSISALLISENGTAACIADLFTFPLDTAKVRLQIQGETKIPSNLKSAQYKGVFGTISTMVKTEGPKSLYNGLVAGLQRQMSFASVRIGLYDSVKQFYTKGSEHVGIGSRLLAGCTTGAMAVAVAQPTDVVKVRFQAQANASTSRRYKGTMDAYKTIAKEEGMRGLWKGLC
ncbi:mitochondrial uncoupling 3 [Pelobates cultripes]|uniref:Mitochondrial uncoupling 3 n=1 Tax=Pelobates cultripes TaxID=61616 RepID=A0AAD1VMX4_PELCU|nr:mitochondrial uncoupling 3 [Pelobates cultripes]